MRSPRWMPGGASPQPSPPGGEAEESDNEMRRRERRSSETDAASAAAASPQPSAPRWASPARRASRSAPPSPQASPRWRGSLPATWDEASSPRNALLMAAIVAPFALAAGSALRTAHREAEADALHAVGTASSQAQALAAASAAAQQQPRRRVAQGGSPRGAQQPAAPAAPAAQVALLSLNVGGVSSRWRERLPEIRALIRATQPDVVAMQAVLCCEAGQAGAIVAASSSSGSGDGAGDALSVRYTLYGCRAAIAHMARFGGAPSALYCIALRCVLALRPLAALAASAPSALARLREALSPADAPLAPLLALLARALQAPFFGNAIAVAERLNGMVGVEVSSYDTLPLGQYRVAQRLQLTLRAAGHTQPLRVWLVNVHMHHGGATPAEQNAAYAAAPVGAAAAASVRLAQAQRLLAWLDGALAADKAAPRARRAVAVLLAGSLNAAPGEAAHDALRAWGFAQVAPPPPPAGCAPTPTWPTPLKAPQKEWGAPAAVDAIMARPLRGAAVRVLEARRCGDAPSASDPQLFPSDHFALLARLEITAPPERDDGAAAGQ